MSEICFLLGRFDTSAGFDRFTAIDLINETGVSILGVKKGAHDQTIYVA